MDILVRYFLLHFLLELMQNAKKTTNFPYVLQANLPSAIFVPGDRDAAKRLK